MIDDGSVPVVLPGGLWKDGDRYQEAALRSLQGRDEATLLVAARGLRGRAAWTTMVLHRCLRSLGPLELVSAETVRSLTIGDREALLLHLRRLTFGETLPTVLSCPACEEKLELELTARELLLPPRPHETPIHEATVASNGKSHQIHFRLPTGADQEAVSEIAADQPEEAARQLLRRCVDRVVDANGTAIAENAWPASLIDKLSGPMKELDPQAELVIQMQCPFCEHTFSLLFDTASYFSQELERRETQFYQEIHTLAFYYHWSEQEIMHMTPRKRGRYIELINDTLSEGRRL